MYLLVFLSLLLSGLKVNFKNDATHDFRPGSDIDKISSSMIKKSICGMVNSGKFSIKPNCIHL